MCIRYLVIVFYFPFICGEEKLCGKVRKSQIILWRIVGCFIQILKMEKMFLQNKSCLKRLGEILLELLVYDHLLLWGNNS